MNSTIPLAATLVAISCIESCCRPDLAEHNAEITPAVCPIYLESSTILEPDGRSGELTQAGTGFLVGLTIDDKVRVLLMSAAHVFDDINRAKDVRLIYLGLPTRNDPKLIKHVKVPCRYLGDAYPYPPIDMSYCEITEGVETIEMLYGVGIRFIPLDDRASRDPRSVKNVSILDGKRFLEQGVRPGSYGFALVSDPNLIRREDEHDEWISPIKLVRSKYTAMTTNNTFATAYGLKRKHYHDAAIFDDFEKGNSGGPVFCYGYDSKLYFAGILMGGSREKKTDGAIAPVYFMYEDLPGLVKKSSGK